jgi:hypothetical protein
LITTALVYFYSALNRRRVRALWRFQCCKYFENIFYPISNEIDIGSIIFSRFLCSLDSKAPAGVEGLKPAPLLGSIPVRQNSKPDIFFVECAELRVLTFDPVVEN